jgi:hypothetical protein
MRLVTLSLILAVGMSAAPLARGAAQTPPDTTTKVKKPSKAGKIAKGLGGAAATAAAGAGVNAVLGNQAGGVANALGGVAPCGTGYGVTAGAAIVGAAKGIVKTAVDTTQTAAAPCPAGLIPGMPAGIPGLPSASGLGAAAAGAALGGVLGGAAPGAGAAGGMGGMGGMGAVASMTPVGLAVSAAPGAIKGLKGMFGAKPQDKTAMLRELGKGKLELKYVKFIEGTLEFEPGFEAGLVTFAEAIALVEGTYLMHVSAEAARDKGAAPDTALARKRVAKVWTLMAANGVSDQKVFAVSELPASLSAGRKLPKAGEVKIEIMKFDKQP